MDCNTLHQRGQKHLATVPGLTMSNIGGLLPDLTAPNLSGVNPSWPLGIKKMPNQTRSKGQLHDCFPDRLGSSRWHH